jgi:hypothetical protein
MQEEPAISELDLNELQSVCEATDLEIRRFIFSKVAGKLVEDLNVTVGVNGFPPSSIDIEVEIQISPILKSVDADRLIEDAVDYGFRSAEEKAKEILACRSKN